MITAVDSNVLLDLLVGSVDHGRRSAAALRNAALKGALIASIAVWAEVTGASDDPRAVSISLDRLGVELVPDDREIAVAAGRIYRAYRKAGGRRRRILPDFLIGAHATLRADRLLTRDRGFYRAYFTRLSLIVP